MRETRLSARLLKGADLLSAYPGQKTVTNNDRTATSGIYRLIEQPEEREVTAENIVLAHRERSIERICGQHTVIAIQGGTDLNFTTRPGSDGLDVIDRTGKKRFDLHLHATLVVTDTGLPLGMLRIGFDTEKPAARGNIRHWREGFTDVAQAVSEVSQKTRVISVCDGEAGGFELFDVQRRHPRVELLVRVRHDRDLGCARLFELMGGEVPDGLIDVEIEALAARSKGKKAGRTCAGRLACCELRLRRVTLSPTAAEPVTVSAVHIVEIAPPEGEVPVEWRLLTTLKVGTVKEAAEIIGCYLQRQRIEDYFRVLKSGCRTEFLMFHTVDQLPRAIAINAVIAWRIMVMTLLGRHVPDGEPELLFADHELDFLRDYALEYGCALPKQLGDAVQLVAHFGGYRDRKYDPDPGNQIMWHGQTRLTSAALGHRIGLRVGRRQARRSKE